MDDLPYLAVVGGGAVSVVLARWAFRRYDLGGRRLLGGLVVVGAVYVGCLIYFVLGFLFVMVRPDQTHEIWAALGHGLRSCGFLMLAATMAACTSFRARSKPAAPPRKPEGNVRQHLLQARGDLEARIERVRSSPVMNYRGGVAETDLIVEQLADKISEIDAVLTAPEQKN